MCSQVGRGLCLWAISTAFRLDPPCSPGEGRLSRRAEDVAPYPAGSMLTFLHAPSHTRQRAGAGNYGAGGGDDGIAAGGWRRANSAAAIMAAGVSLCNEPTDSRTARASPCEPIWPSSLASASKANGAA